MAKQGKDESEPHKGEGKGAEPDPSLGNLTPSKERLILRLASVFRDMTVSALGLTSDSEEELRPKLWFFWSCAAMLAAGCLLVVTLHVELPQPGSITLIEGYVSMPDLVFWGLLVAGIIVFLLLCGSICAVLGTSVWFSHVIARRRKARKDRREAERQAQSVTPEERERQEQERERQERERERSEQRQRLSTEFEQEMRMLKASVMKESVRKQRGEKLHEDYMSKLAELDRQTDLEDAHAQHLSEAPPQQMELALGNEEEGS